MIKMHKNFITSLMAILFCMPIYSYAITMTVSGVISTGSGPLQFNTGDMASVSGNFGGAFRSLDQVGINLFFSGDGLSANEQIQIGPFDEGAGGARIMVHYFPTPQTQRSMFFSTENPVTPNFLDGVIKFDIVMLSGSVNIDHITMSAIGDFQPVPLPTAAWLLGSGLLGLIGVARRKG